MEFLDRWLYVCVRAGEERLSVLSFFCAVYHLTFSFLSSLSLFPVLVSFRFLCPSCLIPAQACIYHIIISQVFIEIIDNSIDFHILIESWRFGVLARSGEKSLNGGDSEKQVEEDQDGSWRLSVIWIKWMPLEDVKIERDR